MWISAGKSGRIMSNDEINQSETINLYNEPQKTSTAFEQSTTISRSSRAVIAAEIVGNEEVESQTDRRPAPEPIPEDFKEPVLPGLGKYKSKAESNRKKYEKLFAKMNDDSTVVDEESGKTYRKYKDGDTSYWFDQGLLR